jgi:hypothetical protein
LDVTSRRKRGKTDTRRAAGTRITRKELRRRLSLAVEAAYEAADDAIGTDVEPFERSQGLVWLFAHLLGGEFAHLVYLCEDHQAVEQRINCWMAEGIEQYASLLRRSRSSRDAAQVLKLLHSISRRLAGPFSKGERPQLELVREPAADSAPTPSPAGEEDAVRV